jgi:phosphoribosylaminoimidazole (AIR) synthetase
LAGPAGLQLIQRTGGIADAEMDRTFNQGLGMILVVGKKDVANVTKALEKMRERYFIIGDILRGTRGVSLIS